MDDRLNSLAGPAEALRAGHIPLVELKTVHVAWPASIAHKHTNAVASISQSPNNCTAYLASSARDKDPQANLLPQSSRCCLYTALNT